jgi:hypothetical protein
MRGLAVNFALMQLRNNTFKDVQKITIDGNFVYVAASPKPTNLISNMQLLYNETFGIYVQKDKSTGDFYQPYSNIKVDPGALVYNAKLEAFLKSMSGGAGHGLSFDERPPLISHPRGVEGTSSWYNLKVRLENLDQLLEGNTYHADDPSNSAASAVLSTVSQLLPPSSVLMSFYKLTQGSDPITGQKIAPTEQFITAPIDMVITVSPLPSGLDFYWNLINTTGYPRENTYNGPYRYNEN